MGSDGLRSASYTVQASLPGPPAWGRHHPMRPWEVREVVDIVWIYSCQDDMFAARLLTKRALRKHRPHCVIFALYFVCINLGYYKQFLKIVDIGLYVKIERAGFWIYV